MDTFSVDALFWSALLVSGVMAEVLARLARRRRAGASSAPSRAAQPAPVSSATVQVPVTHGRTLPVGR